MKTTIRADHIGSFIRPKVLLDEIHRIYEPGHTAKLKEERAKDATQLRQLEDAAIRDVLARQESLGLQVVTDGEFRRLMYFNSFYDAVDGVAPSTTKLQFRDDDGSVVEHEGPAAIVGRIVKTDSPAAREVAFLRPLTERAVKATFPTASFLVFQTLLGPALSSGAYRSMEEAADALVDVMRQLVDDAIEAGADYVQFDGSGYTIAAGPMGNVLRARGIDLPRLLDKMRQADDRVVEGLPAHVTTCLHQCRGNYASRYLIKDDHFHEMSEAIFAMPYDRFTLEWDNRIERTEADYQALANVPKGGATVVLGVVSTKHPELESEDQILATVEHAAKHIPIEQLAISPQCGFASALTSGDDGRPDGNIITEDTQWRKLDLLVRTAERIWGSA